MRCELLHSLTPTDSARPDENQFLSAGPSLLSVRRNLQIARKYAAIFFVIPPLLTLLLHILNQAGIRIDIRVFCLSILKNYLMMKANIIQSILRVSIIKMLLEFHFSSICSPREKTRNREEMMLTSVNARSNDQLPSLAHFL